MMQLHSLIERLGYSPHEAAVYLSALALDGSTETELAAHAKLPRTTVASVVLSLRKKELMNAYLKGRRRIWNAEDPSRLLSSLTEREAALRAALPMLHSLRRGKEASWSFRVHEGTEGIRHILSDIVASKHHVRAILPWDDWVALLGVRLVARFASVRKRHFLRIHLLVPRTRLAAGLVASDGVNLQVTRFLPEGVSIGSAHFLYGNKVAIVSLGARPKGVIMEDPGIRTTEGVLFESLWVRSGGTFDEL